MGCTRVVQLSATPDLGLPCMRVPGSNATTCQLPSTTGVPASFHPCSLLQRGGCYKKSAFVGQRHDARDAQRRDIDRNTNRKKEDSNRVRDPKSDCSWPTAQRGCARPRGARGPCA